MKIRAIEDLRCDAGWRTLSFLKITTETGLVGWSEFSEGRGTPALRAVIRALAERVIGDDPRNLSRLSTKLYGMTRTTAGGMIAQAIAAIENACLDIKAKSLGLPVYELFGGSQRDRLSLYWSQCGTLRVRHPDLFGAPPVRTLDDMANLGREAVQRGFRALKTNILLFGPDGAANYQSGFGAGAGHPEINVDRSLLRAIVDTVAALRQGAGPDMDLLLDLNCNVKPEGARQIAKALEPYKMMWLEYDLHDPKSLAAIRQSTTIPIAALETVYGRRGLRPYLEQNSVDVVIVDPQWNGMLEAVRMATLVDSFEVNVAIHNYHGYLSTLIGAHFAAVIPNLRVTEFVVDEAPWTKDFFTHPLQIDNGVLVVPDRPGWGTDIDEAAVRAHPAE
jgi:L-alanine-DL-glutamate epimerase-like enolase superfamily enzyme